MGTSFLEVEHGKIAYDVQGSGPLVVCAPSLGDLRAEYRFLIPQLVEAGFRAASLDLRGQGESSTGFPAYSIAGCGSDLLALIRHLGGGPAVIVATSMSAAAAVWAAAEAPEQVSGVVLIGPFVRGNSSWQDRLLYGVLLARPWGPALWKRYFTSLYPTRQPQDFAVYLAALQENVSQPGRLEALRGFMFASKDESEARLPRVKARAMVLMGTRDPDFKHPESEAQWVADRLQATLHMIPGAGHYPHAEMPELAGPLILNFLDALQEQPSQREPAYVA